MESFEDVLALAAYAHDRVNPYLFSYALSVALLHRPDTKKIQLPPLYEIFPDKYVEKDVLRTARKVSKVYTEENRVSSLKLRQKSNWEIWCGYLSNPYYFN